jgi:NAD(P)H-hydrate epimerase
LAGRAALRSGAGLVTVATPRSCQNVVAALAPEYMTLALPEEVDGTVSATAADAILAFGADAIAVGPGLGRTPAVRSLVDALLAGARAPLVLDADAIAVFAGAREHLRSRTRLGVVLTPHPGEMAALLGCAAADVQAQRLTIARDVADELALHVVLKGHRTVTATPDGRMWINTTGNPGMATAGAGDVLTGVVAAWLAQIHDPGEAAA